LRLAYGIERHDRVLDVGCRAGLTTREAARMAVEGSVLGIDLSAWRSIAPATTGGPPRNTF
jgi:cyclopropane fatty-acyl-phospholipid synthase-like methyltransferase